MTNITLLLLLLLPLILYLWTRKIMLTHIIFGTIFLLIMIYMSSIQVVGGNIFSATWVVPFIKMYVTIIIFDLYRYSKISEHVEEMLDLAITNKRGLPIIVFFLAGIIAFYSNIVVAFIISIFILYTLKISKTLIMSTVVIIISAFWISSNEFIIVKDAINNLSQNIDVMNYLAQKNMSMDEFSQKMIDVITSVSFISTISFYFVVIYMIFYSFFKLNNLRNELRENYTIYFPPIIAFVISSLIFREFLPLNSSYIAALLIGLVVTIYFNERADNKLVEDFEDPIAMEKENNENKLYISSVFAIVILIAFLFLWFSSSSFLAFLIGLIAGTGLIIYLIKQYGYTKREWKGIFFENTKFILKALLILIIMDASFNILATIVEVSTLAQGTSDLNFTFISLFLILIHNFMINISEVSIATLASMNPLKIGYSLSIFYLGMGINLLLWYIIANFIDGNDDEIFNSFWVYTVGYIIISLIIIILILISGLR